MKKGRVQKRGGESGVALCHVTSRLAKHTSFTSRAKSSKRKKKTDRQDVVVFFGKRCQVSVTGYLVGH